MTIRRLHFNDYTFQDRLANSNNTSGIDDVKII